VAERESELEEAASLERSTLRALLAINGAMFIAEALAGWWAQSTGLLADAVDMLADAAVYGIAPYAVGRAGHLQATAATLSGVLQVALGLGVLAEVVRRLFQGSAPASIAMMGVSTVALLANLLCLSLIAKHRQGGVHMRASWIFSVNDVIANLGVIVAGGLVLLLGSRLPDLVIGTLIAVVVVRGGVQILSEAAEARRRG
jgi:Co/Zn/Cd efflux system component